MAHWFSEGQYDLSPEAVEYVGWSGWIGHYHVAIKQLLEREVLLGDITREVSIITTELEETLRPG